MMKVSIVSERTDLRTYFEKEFDVNFANELNRNNNEVLLMGSSLVSINDIQEYSSFNENAFYILEENVTEKQMKRVKTVCDSHGIKFIHPGMSCKQIYEFVYERVFEPTTKQKNNVISFFSPVSNIGTTTTVLSTAYSIAQHSNLRIAVLGLNAWDDGTDFIENYNGKSLDQIKSDLSNQIYDFEIPRDLERDSFIQNMQRINTKGNHFYYLSGNQSIKLERNYTIEEIDYLISVAKEKFDLVLIDAGSHFDNALMFQSLYHANLKLIIVNQQQKAIKKFIQIYNDLLLPIGYEKDDFLLVINMFRNENGLLTIKNLKELYEVDMLTYIPFIDYTPIKSEQDGSPLYHYGLYKFNQEIDKIARSSSGMINYDLSFDDEIEEKSSIKSLFKIGK